MPESGSETFQQLTFSGGLSLRVLIAIGIVLLMASALLLWRELQGGRRVLGPVLWLLRGSAIAIVIWMLAAPSLTTRVRHTRPKSLAVLLDRSASMQVSDDADALEHDPIELRWLMQAAQLDTRAARPLDAAAAHTLMAARSLPRSGEVVTDSARQGSRRTRTGVSDLLNSASGELDEAVRADTRLASQIQTVHDRLTARMEAAPPPERDDEASRQLHTELTTLAGRMSNLADASAGNALKALRPEDRDRLRAQAERRRADLAAAWLQEDASEWLGAIRKQARLLTYTFDKQVTPHGESWNDAAQPTDGASGTDLTAALSQLAQAGAAAPLTAAIVLTDGGHNAKSDPLKTASGLAGLPVYVVPIGQTRAVRDVLIHHVQAPRGVFKNDTILIEGMIDAHGCNGEELALELIQVSSSPEAGLGVAGGQSPAEITVIETQHLPVTSDTSSHVFSFRWQADQIGMQHFVVRVPPLPDERVNDNNQEKLSVEVTEDKIRLLLADHLPRWEHRYLRNLFKRDTRVQMDELLFEPMRSGGAPAVGQRWPTDLDAWGQYRLAILGDIGPMHLDAVQQELLERYVRERGGTLILIAGEEAMPASLVGTPLERLLPVEEADLPTSSDPGFAVFVTTEGSAAPALQLADDPATSDRLWREQVVLHRLSPFARPRPSSHVWLGTAALDAASSGARPEQAFLCWQDYGAGRVIYFSAPMTYRLRYRQGDTYHHRFWGQLLRWAIARDVAAGSLTVHLTTDKARYEPGDIVRAWARLTRLEGEVVGGSQLSVTAAQDERPLARIDLKEEATHPGRYLGTLRGLPPGSVRLRVEGPDVDALLQSEGRSEPVDTIVVIDPPSDVEMRNTRCNLPLLQQIAQATGGQVLAPEAVGAVVSKLDLAPEVSEDVSEQPLWTRWSFLWLFVGCLTAEWVIRKVAGMA